MKVFKDILKTFSFGLLAGLAIALGGFASLFLKFDSSAISSVLQAFIFTIGLFLICVLGLYLYTGKIGYILGAKKKFIIDLPIILLGNFVGAALFGYVFYFFVKSGNIQSVQTAIEAIVNTKTATAATLEGFGVLFLKGIMCGFCVFLAVFIFQNAKNTGFKYLGLILPIMAFVMCGFEHCIANVFYFSIGNSWNLNSVLNIIYVTVGNSIGSIMLYGLFKLIKVEAKI
jgi:formate/nitrite transporter FocA (FNT family)